MSSLWVTAKSPALPGWAVTSFTGTAPDHWATGQLYPAERKPHWDCFPPVPSGLHQRTPVYYYSLIGVGHGVLCNISWFYYQPSYKVEILQNLCHPINWILQD